MLARLYTEGHRYREPFMRDRSAMAAHPDWDMTRRMARRRRPRTVRCSYSSPSKGDAMAPIDALVPVLRISAN